MFHSGLRPVAARKAGGWGREWETSKWSANRSDHHCTNHLLCKCPFKCAQPKFYRERFSRPLNSKPINSQQLDALAGTAKAKTSRKLAQGSPVRAGGCVTRHSSSPGCARERARRLQGSTLLHVPLHSAPRGQGSDQQTQWGTGAPLLLAAHVCLGRTWPSAPQAAKHPANLTTL